MVAPVTVYLDHAATTPMREEAREAWLDASRIAGNASSIHAAGQSARRLLEESRERLAVSLDCDPIEVVLTSGGTESINLAITGLWCAAERRRAGVEPGRVVTSTSEHHATLDTVDALAQHGASVDLARVDGDGRLDLAHWTALVGAAGARVASLLAANNEVGTIQPVKEAIGAAADAGVPVHLDAVGAFGHIPLAFRSLRGETRRPGSGRGTGLVAMSVAAHKLGGPVGVGALVVARDADLAPMIHGGGQQRRLRAGTQDVAGAAAFAVAAELALAEMDSESRRLHALGDRLAGGILASVARARLLGDPLDRLPGNVHVLIPDAAGETLLFLLDQEGIAVSTGSACQAGVPEPSHVVTAMGFTELDARQVLRITLGRTTTTADVEALLAVLPVAVERARAASGARSGARS